MSYFIDSRENFVIPEVKDIHKEFISVIQLHLTVLEDYISSEDSFCFYGKDLVVNGKKYDDIKDVIEALNNAESFNIKYFYNCEMSTYNVSEEGFAMNEEFWMGYLASRDDEFLSTVYASLWHKEDCNSNNGSLNAFGNKNGTVYHGEVPFIKVDNIPEDTWITDPECLVCEIENYKAHQAEADAITEKLAVFCHANCDNNINKNHLNIRCCDDGIDIAVFHQDFTSEELLGVFECAKEYHKISPDAHIFAVDEYYNMKEKMLRIEFDDDFNITSIAIAEI